ncbi:hypothetical protein ACFZAM_11055 [Streptomyces sp. NPDC008079]|uniref:hypothetical protein n=1 Tax=Streptomyces sp. NPDC008079 TaxID=3364806 RepID=UPI0036F04884
MSRTVPPGHMPFADPDLVVGRTRHYYPYLALVLAVGADGIAFYQVVGLLVNEAGWMIIPLVLGFTGLALAVSHQVGVLARRFVERSTPAVGALAVVLTMVWLFMGAVCFFVRATNTPATSGGSGLETLGLPSTAGAPADDLTGSANLGTALLFLGLYLAGGLLAAVTAYLAHNPLATAYRMALAHRAAARQEVQRLTPRHVRAVHRHQQELAERERDHRRWEVATGQCLGWADDLKHYARFLMAVHIADPAATDGLTDSGDRLVPGGWKGPDLRAADRADGPGESDEPDAENGQGAAA